MQSFNSYINSCPPRVSMGGQALSTPMWCFRGAIVELSDCDICFSMICSKGYPFCIELSLYFTKNQFSIRVQFCTILFPH